MNCAPLACGAGAWLSHAQQSQVQPAQVKMALQSGARPFPTSGADNGTDPTPVSICQPPSTQGQLQCYCVTGLCGAGMLDADKALAAAEALPRPVVIPTPTPDPGGDSGGGALSWPWLLALLAATAVLSARPRGRRPVRG
jgi:serine protease